MISKTNFLEKYNISDTDFKLTGYNWNDLEKIFKDYDQFNPELEEPTKYILEALHKFDNVHSIRFRIKDSEHLIEKILRRKLDTPDSELISVANYKDIITDLIGFRILQLFKEDWKSIHEALLKKWNLKDDPIAYIREGDDRNRFEGLCKIEIHKYKYRSVHYTIQTTPCKKTYFAEIQVRTIFEEAWSEIDHKMRYPYDRNNPILFQFLAILNGLSGSADEMGSYIVYLKNEIQKLKNEYESTLKFNQNTIDELKKKIKSMEFDKSMKAINIENELDHYLNQIKINPISEGRLMMEFPPDPTMRFGIDKTFNLPSLENTSINLNFDPIKGRAIISDPNRNNILDQIGLSQDNSVIIDKNLDIKRPKIKIRKKKAGKPQTKIIKKKK